MKDFLTVQNDGFKFSKDNETIWVQSWGANAVRVRVTVETSFRDLPQGLLDNPKTPAGTRVEVTNDFTTLTNGKIKVKLLEARKGPSRAPQFFFERSSDGKTLLTECLRTTAEHKPRTFRPHKGTWNIEQRFLAHEDERFYGLGQRQHGFLNQKGCTLDLMHRNSEVSIPFMVSNRGYGFLWNNPGLGEVSLARNETRWTMDQGYQVDYLVICDDTPAKILERYAEVTGKPSEFPEWGSGFWQCKLRYRTQEELLVVAREYHRRKLPVSVMVIDFHHWTTSGDWEFDPVAWPDPSAMVKELKSMGMECMVSVWPTVNTKSHNFDHMNAHGLLLRNEWGSSFQNGNCLEAFYDATHPESRKYHWEQVRKGYVEHGIRLFWLDTMEPEIIPLEPENTRCYLGNHAEVGGLYPICHQQAYFEGLKEVGEPAPMTLGRSAWVGSQRYGSAVWSADIPSTFESLRKQIGGALNIAMSGIPWWTSDMGGFHGGDICDPNFHELLIRWFQFGVFCPIMRVHGVRKDSSDPLSNVEKADPHQHNVGNEVWSYGEKACAILSDQILLRESLRPYVMTHMGVASKTGLPIMRPLFVDFPDDDGSWKVEDQFMFGPDLLVSPITELGKRSRQVYLPSGTQWTNAWTGECHQGGITLEVGAPIESIPVFLKAGSPLGSMFKKSSKR